MGIHHAAEGSCFDRIAGLTQHDWPGKVRERSGDDVQAVRD